MKKLFFVRKNKSVILLKKALENITFKIFRQFLSHANILLTIQILTMLKKTFLNL